VIFHQNIDASIPTYFITTDYAWRRWWRYLFGGSSVGAAGGPLLDIPMVLGNGIFDQLLQQHGLDKWQTWIGRWSHIIEWWWCQIRWLIWWQQKIPKEASIAIWVKMTVVHHRNKSFQQCNAWNPRETFLESVVVVVVMSAKPSQKPMSLAWLAAICKWMPSKLQGRILDTQFSFDRWKRTYGNHCYPHHHHCLPEKVLQNLTVCYLIIPPVCLSGIKLTEPGLEHKEHYIIASTTQTGSLKYTPTISSLSTQSTHTRDIAAGYNQCIWIIPHGVVCETQPGDIWYNVLLCEGDDKYFVILVTRDDTHQNTIDKQ